MTLMADFLIQPAAKNNGRTAARESAQTASQSQQREFSRILHQQRQAADVRPATTASAPPAKTTDNQEAVAERSEQPTLRSDQAQARDETKTPTNERQKDDPPANGVAKVATPALPDRVPAPETETDDETTSDTAELPVALDPLLEQILRAHKPSVTPAEDATAEDAAASLDESAIQPDLEDMVPADASPIATDAPNGPAEAEADDEAPSDTAELPAALNPLLEQMLLANKQPDNNPAGIRAEQGAAETGLLAAVPTGDARLSVHGLNLQEAGTEDGEPALLTQPTTPATPSMQPPLSAEINMAAGSGTAGLANMLHGNDSIPLTQPAALASNLSGVQTAQIGSNQMDALPGTEGDETEGLLLDMGEDDEALLKLTATGLPLREARAEGEVRTAPAQPDKNDVAGLTRSDTLLRSEAVQSAQGARQASGQPLNMQQPGWDKELVDKVMWMSSKNLKSAEIKLNPLELGRLDIRVQVGQEHTQITFNSAHAGVRDSLDAHMQRLREMLEQQGMHNVDVDVADQSQQRQRYTAEANTRAAGAVSDDGEEELQGVSDIEQQESGHAGLVSYYV